MLWVLGWFGEGVKRGVATGLLGELLEGCPLLAEVGTATAQEERPLWPQEGWASWASPWDRVSVLLRMCFCGSPPLPPPLCQHVPASGHHFLEMGRIGTTSLSPHH